MTKRVVSIDSDGHRVRVLRQRDSLATEHLSLVDGIARGIHRRLPPSFALADLVGTGSLALVRAATRFRPDAHPGVPFAGWARLKIRGAILDSVRRGRYADATMAQLWEERHPFIEGFEGLRRSTIGSLAARLHARATPAFDVVEAIDAARIRRRVEAAIALLPRRQQRVLHAYYSTDEPTLAEVGRRLRIGPGSAEGLHRRAIGTLRVRLKAA